MEIQHIKTQDIVKANIYGKVIALNILKISQKDWLSIFPGTWGGRGVLKQPFRHWTAGSKGEMTQGGK